MMMKHNENQLNFEEIPELEEDLPGLEEDLPGLEVLGTEERSAPSLESISTNSTDDETIKKVSTVQRFFRSRSRYRLHNKTFDCNPVEIKRLSETNSRLKNIIFDIAKHHLIIGERVTHWTTWKNLKNIIDKGVFLGNRQLHHYKYFFDKNALGTQDIKYGDGNVICFCPYLVDPTALVDPYISGRDQVIRQGLLRLTIDLTKVNAFGKYNQFFKLYDFCVSGFIHTVVVSDLLSFSFHKLKGYENDVRIDWLDATIIFKGNSFKLSIGTKDAIVYGDLFSFNIFCMNKFVDLIYRDFQFKKELNEYLDGLTDEELRKILIAFGQGLTVFSEYNFNTSLQLTSGLISQIYCANSNKLFSLENLTDEQYLTALKKLQVKEPFQTDIPFSKKYYLSKMRRMYDVVRTELYGVKINYIYRDINILGFTSELSNLAAKNFAGNRYIETRSGMDELAQMESAQLLKKDDDIDAEEEVADDVDRLRKFV